MQTVYIDLLFLINFSMDLLCIIFVSKLTFKKLSPIRAALGAALGGAYSVASLFIPRGFWGAVLDIICCLFICLTAFFKRSDGAKSLFAVIFTYLFSSMLLGGTMTAIFSILNRTGVSLDGGESNDFPPWLVLLVAIAAAIGSYIGGRALKSRASKEVVFIDLILNGRRANFTAMCDSGNLLRDAISGRPVIVVDNSLSKRLIGSKSPPDAHALWRLDGELSSRVTLIPCATACGSKTMVAFRPQKIIIKNRGKSREADALIGFADLSHAPNGCEALIPLELMQI